MPALKRMDRCSSRAGPGRSPHLAHRGHRRAHRGRRSHLAVGHRAPPPRALHAHGCRRSPLLVGDGTASIEGQIVIRQCGTKAIRTKNNKKCDRVIRLAPVSKRMNDLFVDRAGMDKIGFSGGVIHLRPSIFMHPPPGGLKLLLAKSGDAHATMASQARWRRATYPGRPGNRRPSRCHGPARHGRRRAA
jgi:hypothetical protein